MTNLLRALMVLFTLVCAGWALLPMVGIAKNGNTEGASCCFIANFGTAGIIWCVGMIPLGILFLVFRSPTPPQPKP